MIDFSKYPLPKRWRHHVSPYLYFPINENIPEKELYPPLYENFNTRELFKNSKHANVLDIGCGWGRFTIKYSLLNPNDNILGIEIRKEPIEYAKNVISSENITNAIIIWYSVANGLPFIHEKSIDKVFYFFPDPWFKEKHKKRRAFNQNFIHEIHRILKDDGTFYLQSDILDIHNYHKNELDKSDLFHYSEPDNSLWQLPTTDKEEHCIRKSYQYWRLILNKK